MGLNTPDGFKTKRSHLKHLQSFCSSENSFRIKDGLKDGHKKGVKALDNTRGFSEFDLFPRSLFFSGHSPLNIRYERYFPGDAEKAICRD